MQGVLNVFDTALITSNNYLFAVKYYFRLLGNVFLRFLFFRTYQSIFVHCSLLPVSTQLKGQAFEVLFNVEKDTSAPPGLLVVGQVQREGQAMSLLYVHSQRYSPGSCCFSHSLCMSLPGCWTT